jgi:hypothetical protein
MEADWWWPLDEPIEFCRAVRETMFGLGTGTLGSDLSERQAPRVTSGARLRSILPGRGTEHCTRAAVAVGACGQQSRTHVHGAPRAIARPCRDRYRWTAFMFGESGAKRQISGIVFGGGLALFAAQFLTWLY